MCMSSKPQRIGNTSTQGRTGEVSVQDLFDKQKAYLATDMTKTYELENRSAQPSYPHAQTISAFPRHHKVISRPHFRRTSRGCCLYCIHRTNPQTRREWISALDTIERLKPRAVIAGHKKPESDDSPRIIDETRQYIRDFERLGELTTTARELYDRMLELYPDRANPGSLWGSARAVKS